MRILTIGVVHTVRQCGVGRCCVVRDAERLPLLDVGLRNGAVVCGVGGIASEICDLSHRANANDALDRKVGLVSLQSFIVSFYHGGKKRDKRCKTYARAPAKSSVEI